MRGAEYDAHGADAFGNGVDGSHFDSKRSSLSSADGLRAIYAKLHLDHDPSINELLRLAEDSSQKAKLALQRNHLEVALNHYITASELAINAIPRHPDYDYMRRQHPGWNDQFAKLITAVRSQETVMAHVKQKINQSSNMANGQPNGSPRPESWYQSPHLQSSPKSPRPPRPQSQPPLRMPSPSHYQSPNGSAHGSPHKQRHPDMGANTEDRSLGVNGSPEQGDDPLARRFAELRMSRHNRSPDLNGQRHGPGNPGYNGFTPADYGTGSHHQRHGSNTPAGRPLGPRDMNSPARPPTVPPKVPLTTMNTSLPQFPTPAYSPARSFPSQQPYNPPRTSTESNRSRASQQRVPYPGGPDGPNGSFADENPYRARTPNGIHMAPEAPSRSANIPRGPTITPERLYEYLRDYDVLLIDVRPREQFDSGHIYSKSIICLEPVILKENVSAEDLEERLVISPEVEQTLFGKRDEFDLVVYYDQSTRDPSYLAGSPTLCTIPHLRALYDTLYEFNLYKPLKDGRQPALLSGGLDAWIDLVGPHSLATSRTAAIMSTVRTRKPQPLRRYPTTNANSSWEVKKRRLRDYQPLGPEEERVWLERAHKEEIDPNTYETEDGAITEEPGQLGDNEPETISPIVRTYEDFLRRFPEPSEIRESMAGDPAVAPPHLGPHDPSMPPPPSRPAPAKPRPSYGGVSDQRRVQPSLARQASASKTALYLGASPIDRMKLPRTGLVNFGSTCYMNSIIQCLSATVDLTKFFTDNRFYKQVQRNWKGSHGVLPGFYANLIRSLWKGDVEVIRPTSFRELWYRLRPSWPPNQQQDAKEFFDLLIDFLHEDLNLNWHRTQLKSLTREEEMRRESKPIHQASRIEWDRHCHTSYSFISSLFAGQHASQLRCMTCHKTSTSYETFYSLSVEIPPSGPSDLYRCLTNYCKAETLDEDALWKCPHCRTTRKATKQIILTRAPRFLVVHFKRFTAFDKQTRKLHSRIDFPLANFDLGPFMHHPPHQNGDYNHVPTPPPDSNDRYSSPPDPASTPPYLYNAYAIVRHIGSTSMSGHYIALVRDSRRNCWRKFDDIHVTDFIPGGLKHSDSLTNEQAYLVFYERVQAN